MPDIYARIESANRKQKREINDQFRLAELIANNVWSGFNKDVKRAMPWDYYPELFKEDKIHYEAQMKKAELEEYKEKRRAKAARFNQSRQEVIE